MKSCIFLMVYLGALVLPASEGNELPEAKYRDRRFLLGNIFGGNNPPPSNTEAPILPDSSLIDPESFCEGGCHDGWMSYMDQCYMFVQKPMSWEEAERSCQSQATGGHLTSISSAEHNEFLVNLATYQGQRTAQFWTGGRHQKGSSLEWVDGSGANFIQRPLSSLLHTLGETINSILNIRICLKLNINIGGQGNWDGSDCQKKLPFICSYKPNLTPP
ncbi:snaclec coagulation factor IX-binding protein subunit A-like [Rhineura floridana]|uniref:snaclec coagulation factor IX-binding protein subunit A-like n=1 Tax=Rhineura floridana TaxID=261503 RepID=UPI002AC7E9F6|nr:snaclec coagulation factor IX-binding protein subunit A-like [Rhineura floridana]